MNKIQYILAEIGQCAGITGCEHAPKVIADNTPTVAQNIAHTITAENITRHWDALPALRDFSNRLANATYDVAQQGYFPVVIGGDHSCAIGTWSGIAQSLRENGIPDFGMIWIDAHLDLHTPNTTDSGNMHGTPMAVLLGHGDETLCGIGGKHPKIKPQNATFIGIRSYEKPEQELAEKLGATVYYATDVQQTSFKTCLQNAVSDFQNRNIPFGISFDMDSLDPKHITATGTPVNGGLSLDHVLTTLKSTDLTGLMGAEIVEYNPTLDTPSKQDLKTVQQVLACFDKIV